MLSVHASCPGIGLLLHFCNNRHSVDCADGRNQSITSSLLTWSIRTRRLSASAVMSLLYAWWRSNSTCSTYACTSGPAPLAARCCLPSANSCCSFGSAEELLQTVSHSDQTVNAKRSQQILTKLATLSQHPWLLAAASLQPTAAAALGQQRSSYTILSKV